MVRYIAVERGFWEGSLHGPNEKRKIIEVDKPLTPVPKWLKLHSEDGGEGLTPAQKAARTRAAKKAAEEEAKAKADESADVTFLDGGKVTQADGKDVQEKAQVETL